LKGLKRLPYAQARQAATVHAHDFLEAYTAGLAACSFRRHPRVPASPRVDPLAGRRALLARIAERYRIDLSGSANRSTRLRFMTLDWDGRNPHDPSSPLRHAPADRLEGYVRRRLRCDTDHDRHGIVAPSGLMPTQPLPCRRHRLPVPATAPPGDQPTSAVGKTPGQQHHERSRSPNRLAAALTKVPSAPSISSRPARRLAGFRRRRKSARRFVPAPATAPGWSIRKDGIAAALLSARMRRAQRPHAGNLLYVTWSATFRCLGARPRRRPGDAPTERKLRQNTCPPAGAERRAGPASPSKPVLSRAPGNVTGHRPASKVVAKSAGSPRATVGTG